MCPTVREDLRDNYRCACLTTNIFKYSEGGSTRSLLVRPFADQNTDRRPMQTYLWRSNPKTCVRKFVVVLTVVQIAFSELFTRSDTTGFAPQRHRKLGSW